MRQIPFINPTVKTFETDKSDQVSPYSTLSSKRGSGEAPSGQPAPGGGGGPAPTYNFILLEDNFYLLQEEGDNSKFII